MMFQITSWQEDPPNGLFVVRVRCLTADLVARPELVGVYQRTIEEQMLNDFSIEADPESFTRRDLADDESVPEEERPYSYLEMHS